MTKVTTKSKSKNFDMAEVGDWIIATNAFAMEVNDDQFIEIDATNKNKPKVTIKMTKDGENKSFARAAPAVATIFKSKQ